MMNRFHRGGFGMNNFQPRRGGAPGGPMRGAGLMGNANIRNHPFQNQNRRGGNNTLAKPNNQGPQKPQQNQPLIPPPSPGPALTMKGPMQQQQPQKPAQPQEQKPAQQQQTPAKPEAPQQKPAPTPQPNIQTPQPKPNIQTPPPKPNIQTPPPKPNIQTPPPKPNIQTPPPKPNIQTPPPKPNMTSPQPNKNQNQQFKSPMGNANGQQQQRQPQQQSPKTGPQQGQRPGPNQGPRFGQQQYHRPGPPQGPRMGPPQGQRPQHTPQETATAGPSEGQSGGGFKATLSMLLKPGEKTYTQRCRLFIGNLPSDITEEHFRKLFSKYGEPSEVFINKAKGFGFIRLESRALAEIAKAELDETPMKGRPLRVRFATHSAALTVKNLSPFVSNELLEEAFSQFGMVERAVVIVDDRGRSSGKGIVEFASKPAARKALDRCNEGVLLLTSSPRPVVVEPMEQYDDEDGLPEKLAQKNRRYEVEREHPPRFARPGTFEYEYSKRWKSLDEMEKQQREQVEKNMREAREKLESEMEDAFHEHQTRLIRQDLMRRTEELRRMEEMHNQGMEKRKEMQIRQEEERRRREEEMRHKQEMEEEMRRQRDESYRMGNFMDRERDLRMNQAGAIGMNDMAFGAANQKFAMGFEGQQGLAAAAGGLMGAEMRTDRFAQGGGRGMGPGNGGFGRIREEFDGPAKKARF